MRTLRRLFALAACLLATLLVPVAAQAQNPVDPAALEAIVSRFALDRFPDTAKAVEDLSVSGHPQAAGLVEALADGRLVVRTSDRRVLWRDKAGAYRDAASGAAVPEAEVGATKPVRLNNAVRRSVDSALGSLTLMSPDPARRIEAAEAVFKARNEGALEALRAALAKETDPGVAQAFRRTLAALTLLSSQAPETERLAALDIIAERRDVEAQALLRAVPADAPAALREAAEARIKAIDSHLALLSNVQNVFYGVSLGSVLLLAAIGLAITFGIMGVINMAHGEMVMIGAYATFVVQEVIRARAPQLFDYSLLIALPVAFLAAALIGVLIERLVIRYLYGRPLETLLATWGVSLILQQAVRTQFGPNNREVGNPAFMSGQLELFGIALTWSRVWIVAFALAVFLGLLMVLKYTSFGLRMRAVVQNRRMAASMGIRTPAVDAMAFALGSGIAGIAGVALSQIDNVSPNLGQAYIIDSFMVVVFGGVGSLWGAFTAALSLGIANKLLEPLAGAVLGKIIVLVLLILFIQKRPRGLFALKGRAVEA